MKHPTKLATVLGLGLALAELPPAHAVGTTPVVYQNAGRHFASAVTARARAGWGLFDLSVKDGDGADPSDLRVVMLLGTHQQAERATITFSRETGNILASMVESAPLPRETRHYTNQAEVFSALDGGAVTGFEWGCTYIYLDTEKGGVVLDTDAYFIVKKKLKGGAAQEALADELAHHLLAGDTLAEVALQDRAEGAQARGPAPPGRDASVIDRAEGAPARGPAPPGRDASVIVDRAGPVPPGKTIAPSS